MESELVKIVKSMAKKEKRLKEFKRRARIRGKIVKKSLTKNGNIRLRIKSGNDKFNFIVVKTHKGSYALAESLPVGSSVYAQGINRFRTIICTKLKQIRKIDEDRQSELKTFL